MAKKKAAKDKKSKTKTKVIPLGDRVLVQRDEAEDVTAGGILLPESAKDKPARGTILSVGEGSTLADGTKKTLQVKKGDKVLFTNYAGEQFMHGDVEYMLMRESDILAIIE